MMGCSHFDHIKPDASRMRRLCNPCQQSPWMRSAGGFQTYVLGQQCAPPAVRACPEEPSTMPYLTPIPSCSRFDCTPSAPPSPGHRSLSQCTSAGYDIDSTRTSRSRLSRAGITTKTERWSTVSGQVVSSFQAAYTPPRPLCLPSLVNRIAGKAWNKLSPSSAVDITVICRLLA
jgi:hypothetical protein